MKTEEYSIRSADGISDLHAMKWMPEREAKAVIHLTHGMVEHIRRYEDFARFLNEAGFVAAGHDHIGHGDSVRSLEELGDMQAEHPADVMTADMMAHIRLLRGQYPSVPFFVLGHSMGSYLLRKMLSEYAEELRSLGVRGAILAGTGSVSPLVLKSGLMLIGGMAKIRSWKYRSPLVAGLVTGGPFSEYDASGQDLSRSSLTKDTTIARAYLEDPKCGFRFTLRGYKGLLEACAYDNDPENIAKISKDLPVLFASGDRDPVGDMGKGVTKAYEQFVNAGIKDVTLRIYENDRHEILNELDRDMVYRELLQWMQERMH